MKIHIIFFIFFLIEVPARDCLSEFTNVDKRTKDFLRIDEHIAEYHATCNVVYAYSLFLDTPSKMDELEIDNVYAEELGRLVKNYPKISRLITDKSTFSLFNNFDNLDKMKINNVLKKTFSSKELKNQENIAYFILALKINKYQINEKNLIYFIRQLKNNYTLDELANVDLFWTNYSQKYKGQIENSKKYFIYFNETLETYRLSTLTKYSAYANDFYPTLLPTRVNNKEYKYVIKALLKRIKNHQFEEQAYFLKNISLDIELALENGNSKEEIITYFDSFIKKDFIAQIGGLTCHEKEGVSLLISDNLENKLKWISDDKTFFRKVKYQMNKKNKNEILNILALFNIDSLLYTQMDTVRKREIFNSILKLPLTDKPKSSLSLLYTLNNSTHYFSEVINNTKDIYMHNKYEDIFFVSRNGRMILNSYTKGDGKFPSEINDLLNTPYSEINDLTNKEIIENTIVMVDYASYATLIIPGVGIGTQIFKVLGKTSINGLMKKGIKASTEKSLSFLKNQTKNIWNEQIKYSKNKERNTYLNRKISQSDNGFRLNTIGSKLYFSFQNEEQKELCREGK